VRVVGVGTRRGARRGRTVSWGRRPAPRCHRRAGSHPCRRKPRLAADVLARGRKDILSFAAKGVSCAVGDLVDSDLPNVVDFNNCVLARPVSTGVDTGLGSADNVYSTVGCEVRRCGCGSRSAGASQPR